jgi:DNA-binding GntR family transcriptional regulator
MSTKAAPARSSKASKSSKGSLFGQDQKVYDAVFEAVMGQRLPPGTKLTESALCEGLELSRAVVRMGLLRLAHDQIVELRPNRGAAVASPSFDEARAVYDARRLIESAIAERLVGQLSAAQLRGLQDLIDHGVQAFERDDTSRWITLAGQFHISLAQATGNPVLHEQVRALVSRSNLITALYLQPGTTRFYALERRTLVNELKQETPSARRKARRLVEQLLQGVERRLKVMSRADQEVDLAQLLKGH